MCLPFILILIPQEIAINILDFICSVRITILSNYLQQNLITFLSKQQKKKAAFQNIVCRSYQTTPMKPNFHPTSLNFRSFLLLTHVA